MQRKRNQPLILKMDLPHKIIHHRLRRPVRPDRLTTHPANTPAIRADDHKLRPRRRLQQRQHSLKQHNRPNRIDREMTPHLRKWRCSNSSKVRRDARIGDDDVHL